MKKLLAVLLALVLCLSVSAVSLAEAAMTGRYISTQNMAFVSAYPQYTFKMATFGIQTLELYDDGTYRLIDTENSFSGGLIFADDGTYEAIPRGGDVYVYTGTYEAISDSGLLMVTLSAPTGLEVTSSNSIETKSATAEGTDLETLLAKFGFADTDIMIDEATGVFDFIVTGPQE